MLVSYRAPQHYACCYNTTAPGGQVIQSRLVLKPGVNEVSREQWAQVKDHPAMRRRINQGLIEVLSEGDESEHASELAKLRPNEARRLVAETIDVDVLEKWREVEDRETVLEALEKQVGKVSKTVDEAERDAKAGKKRRSRRKKGPSKPATRVEEPEED